MSAQKHFNVERGLRRIMVSNFVGGVAWGLGVTVGASVLLGILGYFASNIGIIPVIGKFIQDLLTFLNQNSPQMR